MGAHPLGWSRRGLLYLLVGLQLGALGTIVVFHELNQALDRGPAAPLDIPQARASKDPFRGAAVSGQVSLSLNEPHLSLPAGELKPGEQVLVYFTMDAEHPPRIVAVDRRGWGPDPLFGRDSFSIPGHVIDESRHGFFDGGPQGPVARVGTPAISVALEIPGAIPVADAALDDLSNPSFIQASLRRGAFGHRFLTDVRLAGQSFPPQMGFAYDPRRDRLTILADRGEAIESRTRQSHPSPRTSLFRFDGSGKEVGRTDLVGHAFEGVYNPPEETLLALVSQEPYLAGPVQLAELSEEGTIIRRGPQIHADRILGFDRGSGRMWALTGTPTSSPQPPFFVQRFGLDGFDGPRMGPIASRPRCAVNVGHTLWVVETDRSRVSRYDSSGALAREYWDLNRPTEIAVGARSFLAIEANQTQLTRFAFDGTVLWRAPRFQGLAWILPEPGTEGGWVAATQYENGEGGIFRYDTDGRIVRLPAVINPRPYAEWSRGRLAGDVIGDLGHGRFYVREPNAIAIVRTDGTLIRRVNGFRFVTPRPLPQ